MDKKQPPKCLSLGKVVENDPFFQWLEHIGFWCNQVDKDWSKIHKRVEDYQIVKFQEKHSLTSLAKGIANLLIAKGEPVNFTNLGLITSNSEPDYAITELINLELAKLSDDKKVIEPLQILFDLRVRTILKLSPR